MVEDIQAAADVFRPPTTGPAGRDGFVSIEVSPVIAHDTHQTIAMAEELHARCARPNVMIKIPAATEGPPAIRHMIAQGKNVNVILFFSVARTRRGECGPAFGLAIRRYEGRGARE